MESSPALAIAPLRINEKAPEFKARTTMGDVALGDYRGRWLLLFSHPADFTPVCTSEFIAFARAKPRFDALPCSLLALSVDGLYSHLAWIRDIHSRFGVTVDFPIVEDPSMAIARGYGMIDANATDSSTARATYVIDPDGIVRAMSWYPASTGRSIEELLRLVAALQAGDREQASTPEGWKPGSPLLELAPADSASVLDCSYDEGESWYFRWRKP